MTKDQQIQVWQQNALIAIRNQRDLLIFFINALDQAEPDELRDSLVEMLILSRDMVARAEEQIL